MGVWLMGGNLLSLCKGILVTSIHWSVNLYIYVFATLSTYLLYTLRTKVHFVGRSLS